MTRSLGFGFFYKTLYLLFFHTISISLRLLIFQIKLAS